MILKTFVFGKSSISSDIELTEVAFKAISSMLIIISVAFVSSNMKDNAFFH